jgi:hypothetical protein
MLAFVSGCMNDIKASPDDQIYYKHPMQKVRCSLTILTENGNDRSRQNCCLLSMCNSEAVTERRNVDIDNHGPDTLSHRPSNDISTKKN